MEFTSTSCTRFKTNWYGAYLICLLCDIVDLFTKQMKICRLKCNCCVDFLNCMKNINNVLKMCSSLAINRRRSSASKNINLLIHKIYNTTRNYY